MYLQLSILNTTLYTELIKDLPPTFTVMLKFNYSKYNPRGLIFGGAYTWKEFSFSESWFLNAPGLIHGGAHYRDFTVCRQMGYHGY